MWLKSEVVLQIPSNATKFNNHTWKLLVAVVICLLSASISITNAVPTSWSGTSGQLYRSTRETNINDESSKDLNETGSIQPKGTCLLDGIPISETTVFCEKKVGCRAIQKTGQCCPDYKCDCEKDGKIYLNGDKLVDHGTPCTVCYCQGGEILCSSVTCYKRDDCEPKYIPGRCCPEYDNCPVSLSDYQNKSITNKNDVSLQPSKPEMVNNPLGIKIKEITKPEEIRITNQKPNSNPPVNERTSLRSPIVATTESLFVSNGGGKLIPSIINGTKLTKVPSGDVQDEREGTKINIKREFAPTTEGIILEIVSSRTTTSTTTALPEFINRQPNRNDIETAQAPSSIEQDPESAGSDNIYHIILTTDGPNPSTRGDGNFYQLNRFSSTEGYRNDQNPMIYPDLETVSDQNTTKSGEPTLSSSQTFGESSQSTIDLIGMSTSTSKPEIMSSTENHFSSSPKPFPNPSQHHIDDDDSTPVESNPAYPTIVDEDLSNYPRDMLMPLNEPEDYPEPEPWAKSHFPENDQPRSSFDSSKSKLLDDQFIFDGVSSTVEPNSKLESSSIMSSTEETSSTTTTTAIVDSHPMNLTISLTKIQGEEEEGEEEEGEEEKGETIEESSEAIELDVSSGSGSGDSLSEENINIASKLKHREPTTPKTIPETFDIDELGSADNENVESLANDPKQDAESLKLDDASVGGVGKSTGGEGGGSKGNVLEVKTYPADDKTLIESINPIAAVRNQRIFLHPIF